MKQAYTGGLPAGWEIATERQDDLCGLLYQEHKGAQGSKTQKSVRGTQLRGQHLQTPRKTVSSFACPKTRDWKASDGRSRGTLRWIIEGKEWSLLGMLLMPRTEKKQHGRRYEKSSRPNTKDRQHGGNCRQEMGAHMAEVGVSSHPFLRMGVVA